MLCVAFLRVWISFDPILDGIIDFQMVRANNAKVKSLQQLIEVNRLAVF